MNFEKIEYLVGDDPDAPDILVVDADGSARFHLHSNEFAPEEPVVGEFQTMLPPDRMADLNQLLASPPFESLPDHWKRIRPGERNRRIKVTRGEQVSEKFLAFREPIDSTTQRVLDALDRLAHDLKSHPLQALKMEIARIDVSQDQELTAMLTFSSVGTHPLTLRSPIGMSGDEQCQVQFQAWPDKPRSELLPDDLITLDPVLVERLDGDSVGTSPLADLGPGESVSYGIRLAMVNGKPGQYMVRAMYINAYGESEQKQVMTGELFSRPVPATLP